MIKRLIILVIIITVVFSLTGCKKGRAAVSEEVETPFQYAEISADEAKELIDSNTDLIIIDFSPFYKEGHIPEAVNYYIGDGSLDEAIAALDKKGTYLVYCHSDDASIIGVMELIDAGFKNIYRLEGNFASWVDAGYEVEFVEDNIPSEGEVTFKTEDGIDISGNIFGTEKKWVILSHMYHADQTSWYDFAGELAGKDYIVLTYDFRGYGKSGGDKDIPNIYKDLEAALDFIKQYDNEKIFLIGSDIGGTASLIVASKEEVNGVISFSSTLEFMGFSAKDNVKDILSPKLFMASQGDGDAIDASNEFYKYSPLPKNVIVLDGSSHGTSIFEEEPDNAEKAKQAIIDFLDHN